ncbi:MAG: hypothetical protein Q8P39_02490, partial [Candidatus Yanofskybacteria bacterium]|nr:hypothetical protein [Candidatus Yanofskybacteria bacterium]
AMTIKPDREYYPLLKSDRVVGDVSSLPEAQRLYTAWRNAAQRAARKSIALAYGGNDFTELERLNAAVERAHAELEVYLRKELSLPEGTRLKIKEGWKVVMA